MIILFPDFLVKVHQHFMIFGGKNESKCLAILFLGRIVSTDLHSRFKFPFFSFRTKVSQNDFLFFLNPFPDIRVNPGTPLTIRDTLPNDCRTRGSSIYNRGAVTCEEMTWKKRFFLKNLGHFGRPCRPRPPPLFRGEGEGSRPSAREGGGFGRGMGFPRQVRQ